jgi:spermidine synthase
LGLASVFLSPSALAERARKQQMRALLKLHQGRPFVFEDGNLRLLYFNEKSVQSAMRLDAPDELECGYTRAMMAFLLAQPAPAQILMVGLGGGSLLKFCRFHLPASRITVLEIDAEVIALRQQFLIPPDDALLQIIHCDATAYLATQALQVDVLLLDGFDGGGMVAELSTARFYADCHAALAPGGVLVCNMWGKRRLLVGLLAELRQQFDASVHWCRSPDSYNLIVFAFRAAAAQFPPVQALPQRLLDEVLLENLTALGRRMRTLPLPMPGPQLDPPLDPRQADLPVLTLEIDLLMTTDARLPLTDTEWSAAHQ